MRHHGSDLLGPLSAAQRRECRELIVTFILGTDMAVHFKNVDRLSAALSSGDLDLAKREDKTFVLEVLLHAADIGNPCRPERVYRQWTDAVMTEFYNQGDQERSLQLPVSKFFDRHEPNLPKCQLGFMNFIVSPLYSTLAEWLDISMLTDHLNSNRSAMEAALAEGQTGA